MTAARDEGRGPVTVAALFVAKGGAYFGLPDVDPWDEARDARTYAGPWPVVAHPPCARWCQFAGLVEHLWGHKRGDDGGTFASALASVRLWGGVLEHPAFTRAWDAYDLPEPRADGWQRCLDGGWVCEVSQRPYGHRARKLTWLYYVGEAPPPSLDWSRPEPVARLSWCENHGASKVANMGKRERSHTPTGFRDMLLAMARSASPPAAPAAPAAASSGSLPALPEAGSPEGQRSSFRSAKSTT